MKRFLSWLMILVVAVCCAGYIVWEVYRPIDPPRIVPFIPSVEVGLSPEEKDSLHHAQQGAPLLWLGILKSLRSHDTGKTLYEDLERFGFLLKGASEANPHGLPVGFGVEMVPGAKPELPHVSMSCAVCHTGEIHYRGKKIRIDGAPNLVDPERWITHVDLSIKAIKEDEWAALALFASLGDYFVDEPVMQQAVPEIVPEHFESMKTLLAKREEHRGLLAGGHKAADAISLQDGALAPAILANPARELSDEAIELELAAAEMRHLLEGGAPRKEEKANEPLFDQGDGSFFPEEGGILPPVGTPEMESSGPSVLEFARSYAAMVRFINDQQDFNKVIIGAMSVVRDAGPGRDDPWALVRRISVKGFDQPLVVPTSIPPLFYHKSSIYAHHDGNSGVAIDRNILQGLSIGGLLDENHAASIKPEVINELDDLYKKIQPPAWPKEVFGSLNQDLVKRGGEVYREVKYETSLGLRSCADCHNSGAGETIPIDEIGTSPLRLRRFRTGTASGEAFVAELNERTAEIKAATYKRHGYTEPEIAKNVAWRTSDGYVARPLEGIWCSPPYLHNGSVRSLRDLLKPPAKRRSFRIGSREFDPENVGYIDDPDLGAYQVDVEQPGNSPLGHDYGTELSAEDKRALLEYLKSL